METIAAEIVDGYLVVPSGMKPIYLHGQVVHVEGWTAEKEYDRNAYDLYPLADADHSLKSIKVNGEELSQDWYEDFGEPTKEAMKHGGKLEVRDRVR